jgi:hypothetical protein
MAQSGKSIGKVAETTLRPGCSMKLGGYFSTAVLSHCDVAISARGDLNSGERLASTGLDMRRRRRSVADLSTASGGSWHSIRGRLGAGLATFLFIAAAALHGQELAPANAIACTTARDVWVFLNAKDQHDRRTSDLLFSGRCRILQGVQYILLENRNGIEKILVFDRPGDWNAAKAFYTLDDMMQKD